MRRNRGTFRRLLLSGVAALACATATPAWAQGAPVGEPTEAATDSNLRFLKTDLSALKFHEMVTAMTEQGKGGTFWVAFQTKSRVGPMSGVGAVEAKVIRTEVRERRTISGGKTSPAVSVLTYATTIDFPGFSKTYVYDITLDYQGRPSHGRWLGQTALSYTSRGLERSVQVVDMPVIVPVAVNLDAMIGEIVENVARQMPTTFPERPYSDGVRNIFLDQARRETLAVLGRYPTGILDRNAFQEVVLSEVKAAVSRWSYQTSSTRGPRDPLKFHLESHLRDGLLRSSLLLNVRIDAYRDALVAETKKVFGPQGPVKTHEVRPDLGEQRTIGSRFKDLGVAEKAALFRSEAASSDSYFPIGKDNRWTYVREGAAKPVELTFQAMGGQRPHFQAAGFPGSVDYPLRVKVENGILYSTDLNANWEKIFDFTAPVGSRHRAMISNFGHGPAEIVVTTRGEPVAAGGRTFTDTVRFQVAWSGVNQSPLDVTFAKGVGIVRFVAPDGYEYTMRSATVNGRTVLGVGGQPNKAAEVSKLRKAAIEGSQAVTGFAAYFPAFVGKETLVGLEEGRAQERFLSAVQTLKDPEFLKTAAIFSGAMYGADKALTSGPVVRRIQRLAMTSRPLNQHKKGFWTMAAGMTAVALATGQGSAEDIVRSTAAYTAVGGTINGLAGPVMSQIRNLPGPLGKLAYGAYMTGTLTATLYVGEKVDLGLQQGIETLRNGTLNR